MRRIIILAIEKSSKAAADITNILFEQLRAFLHMLRGREMGSFTVSARKHLESLGTR